MIPSVTSAGTPGGISARSTSTVPSLRNGATVLAAARAKLQAELLGELGGGVDGWQLGAHHAARLDRVLAGQLAWTARSVRPPVGLAMAAVGSLGRGAVALYSDADI